MGRSVSLASSLRSIAVLAVDTAIWPLILIYMYRTSEWVRGWWIISSGCVCVLILSLGCSFHYRHCCRTTATYGYIRVHTWRSYCSIVVPLVSQAGLAGGATSRHYHYRICHNICDVSTRHNYHNCCWTRANDTSTIWRRYYRVTPNRGKIGWERDL